MPVTPKLDKALRDRLGDEVANELIDFLNQWEAGRSREVEDMKAFNFAPLEYSSDSLHPPDP